MNHIVLNIPIYHGKFSLVVTPDTKDLCRIFTKESLERTRIIEDYPHAHALKLSYKGWTCYTILLNPFESSNPITHGTIAHEAVHIADMIFERKGVSYTLQEDEVMAYLTEWVTDQCYKYLNKWDLLKLIKIS